LLSSELSFSTQKTERFIYYYHLLVTKISLKWLEGVLDNFICQGYIVGLLASGQSPLSYTGCGIFLSVRIFHQIILILKILSTLRKLRFQTHAQEPRVIVVKNEAFASCHRSLASGS